MNPQKYIAGAFLILPFQAISQHRIQHINMLWAGYYHSTKLNEKWALSGDAQIRTSQWTNKWSQFLFRYGTNYPLKNRVTLTVGFAYFKSAEYTTSALLWENEFRPWQEIASTMDNQDVLRINFVQQVNAFKKRKT